MRWLFLLLSELEVEPDSEHYCTPEGTSPVGGLLSVVKQGFPDLLRISFLCYLIRKGVPECLL